ncbi:rhomboid family intramembrane serine protease [Magnetospirillum aberrantis SpK]|uniref:Rhomboid family intramembrane serine protease n=2 Tax=Magnetospirillum TaxID=13134 RepID=A0A7C9QTY5_9PROT|nr:rhomboid family intramembrane serine protease [Magnetospirillum aberrantis SpK]
MIMVSETFARYLARLYVARHGYSQQPLPEAEALSAACDMVLTRWDGMTLEMLCLVDREANPTRRFTMELAELREIGEACLVHTGRLNRSKLPVVIRVVEIGGTPDAERLKNYRTSPYCKARISAYALDPATATVWRNTWIHGWLFTRRMTALMQKPRMAEIVAKEPALTRPKVFPILTLAMLATLAGVFALEQLFPVDSISGKGFWAPSVRTLIALGALDGELVWRGEWFRLLSAAFLHGDAFHLLMNSIAFYYAGSMLERLVGRAWLAALFLVGAVAGSAASMTLNDPGTVSVGASGAIMCLAAATFAVSFRLPSGAERLTLQTNLGQVLVPALIPLAGVFSGHKVDFAAHLGGAVAGAVLGLGLLRAWPRAETLPRLRRLATAMALCGLAAMAVTTTQIVERQPVFAAMTKLAPSSEFPADRAEARRRSAELVARYPADPRAHWARALALVEARDLPAAERELRAGLALPTALALFEPRLRWEMSGMLSIILNERGEQTEAKSVAAPVCAEEKGEMRAQLAETGLCG